MISIIELLLEDRTLTDDQRSLLEKSLRSSEILLDLVGMVLVSQICVSPSNRRLMSRRRTWERSKLDC